MHLHGSGVALLPAWRQREERLRFFRVHGCMPAGSGPRVDFRLLGCMWEIGKSMLFSRFPHPRFSPMYSSMSSSCSDGSWQLHARSVDGDILHGAATELHKLEMIYHDTRVPSSALLQTALGLLGIMPKQNFTDVSTISSTYDDLSCRNEFQKMQK